MGKFAVLFLLAGLAVGLWLGFNPKTHRELTRTWRNATVSQAQERPSSAINLRALDRRITIWLRASPRPSSPPASERGTVPSGPQISATLHAFWQALQQLWLDFLLKLGVHR